MSHANKRGGAAPRERACRELRGEAPQMIDLVRQAVNEVVDAQLVGLVRRVEGKQPFPDHSQYSGTSLSKLATTISRFAGSLSS